MYDAELEARISRLSLYDEMDPSCRQTKHICRARRKRDSSDDDDVDIDDIASSMGSNPLKDAESDDDDDDDEDAGKSGASLSICVHLAGLLLHTLQRPYCVNDLNTAKTAKLCN